MKIIENSSRIGIFQPNALGAFKHHERSGGSRISGPYQMSLFPNVLMETAVVLQHRLVRFGTALVEESRQGFMLSQRLA